MLNIVVVAHGKYPAAAHFLINLNNYVSKKTTISLYVSSVVIAEMNVERRSVVSMKMYNLNTFLGIPAKFREIIPRNSAKFREILRNSAKLCIHIDFSYAIFRASQWRPANVHEWCRKIPMFLRYDSGMKII